MEKEISQPLKGVGVGEFKHKGDWIMQGIQQVWLRCGIHTVFVRSTQRMRLLGKTV